MTQVEKCAVPNGLLANKNGNYTSRSAHVVEEIRKRFLAEEWSTNKKDLYDEIDVERMCNSDWFVKRFLLAARRNADEAYEMLKTTLAWRKSVELSTTPINAFPREFFVVGGLFAYECDREGNPVIYMRIRMHRKIPELRDPIQQFLFSIINKVDQESNGNGAVIVFDCAEAGYANMDLDMLKVLTEVAFKYFPFCIKYVIVYELSWMLNAFRRIAMTIIPSTLAKIVHFANKNDITQYIAVENLPDFMGGTCQRDYRYVPDGCPIVDQLALDRGYTKADVERIRAIYQPYLEEAYAAIEARKRTMEAMNDVDQQNENDQQQPQQQQEAHSSKQMPTLATEDNVDEAATAVESNCEISSLAIIRPNCKSTEEIASLYPQNEIRFHRVNIKGDHHQWRVGNNNNVNNRKSVLTGTVMIRNHNTQDALAFKIQSNKPENYLVTPSQGVILGGAYVCISLTVQSNIVDYHQLNKDKFMVLLCTTSKVQTKNYLQNVHSFNQLFIEQGDKVLSHKLNVALTTLEHENVDENEERLVSSSQTKSSLTSTSVTQMATELSRLRKKCAQLETRHLLLTWFALIVMCFNVLLLLTTTTSTSTTTLGCEDQPTLWTKLTSFMNFNTILNSTPLPPPPITTTTNPIQSAVQFD